MPKTLQYQSLFEPVHGLPVLVQSVSAAITSQSSITINVPNVSKCSALVIGVSLSVDPRANTAGAAPRDDKGDTFSADLVAWDNVHSTKSTINWCFDAVGGTTNVTLSFGLNVTGVAIVYEIAHANALDYGAALAEGSNSTSHNSLSGAIGTTGEGSFILCVGTSSASAFAFTAGSGFTLESSSGDRSMFQRQITTGALLTSGPYTSVSSVSCATVFLSLRYGEACGETNPIGTGWLRQQPDPLPRKVFFDYTALTEPVTVPTSATAPPMGWFIEQQDGQPKPKPAPQGWFCDPTEPTLITPVSMGWYQQQPDAPPKTKPAQPGWFAQSLEPTLFKPFSIGWYVQYPLAPPKTKVPDPGWFTEPIVVPPPPAVAWGWYTQHPGPIQYKRPMAESYFVMPPVLLNFNGVARVFDVHLVTPQVWGVTLVVPVTTLSTLQEP